MVQDPTYILDQARFFLANPQAAASRNSAQNVRQETETEVRRATGWARRSSSGSCAGCAGAMAARERAKSSIAELSIPSKRMALEIGRRLVKAGHMDRPEQAFFLSATDLQCWMENWWDGSGAGELRPIAPANARHGWRKRRRPT